MEKTRRGQHQDRLVDRPRRHWSISRATRNSPRAAVRYRGLRSTWARTATCRAR